MPQPFGHVSADDLDMYEDEAIAEQSYDPSENTAARRQLELIQLVREMAAAGNEIVMAFSDLPTNQGEPPERVNKAVTTWVQLIGPEAKPLIQQAVEEAFRA